MSLGEWEEIPTPPLPDPTPTVAAAPEVPPQVLDHVNADLSKLNIEALTRQLVSSTLAQQIQQAAQEQMAPIVAAAVDELFTEERVAAVRQSADIAAAAELDQPTAADPEAELYYGSVDEFVRLFICPVFRRNVGEEGRADFRWSARWWESAEAIVRLEALWRSWEHLRLDPATGISVWMRDHADHHLGVLMSPTGPWALSRDTSAPDQPLPYEPPPPGLFPDVR